MKTKLIAIAAAAAIVLTPLAGVAAASATTEEVGSSLATSSPEGQTAPTHSVEATGAASAISTATTTSTASPVAASPDTQAPAGTEPEGGSSPSTGSSTDPAEAPSSSTSAPAPSSSPSTSEECTVANRSHVHAERVGPAAFSAWVDAGYECGGWVATFAFDDDYVPTSTGDYRHPQTALEWGFAQLTTTPTVHSVPAPKCGPFQSDFYVGALVFHLADGELGDKWRAGGVVLDKPACTPTEEPSSTPTPGPTQTPTPSPTSEPSPPATGSPSPTTPPGGEPSSPATSPASAPSASPTAGPTAPSAGTVVTVPGVPGYVTVTADDVEIPASHADDDLAYTGSDVVGPLVGAGLLLAAGLTLLLVRRHRRA